MQSRRRMGRTASLPAVALSLPTGLGVGGAGLLLPFSLFKLSQFLFPFCGLLRPACFFVEFHESCNCFLHGLLAADRNLLFKPFQSLIAGKQLRLGIGVFLLRQQNATEKALCAECLPVVREF